jgi:hypothetical protein
VLRLAALVAIAFLLAGCGGGGSSDSAPDASHSVLEVSKVFSDAGLPFTSLVTSNPYVRGQQVYLPLQLNGSKLSESVLAQLNGSQVSTRNGWIAWVFDTDAHAQEAVDTVPLNKWGTGEAKITRAIKGNVIVVASGFVGDEAKSLDDALANLS